MFNLQSIFPTSIITGHLDREITQQELDIVQYHKSGTLNNEGNTTSLDRYILNSYFPEIKKFIESGVKSYVDTVLVPKHLIEFYITQSWLNFTETGQFHHKHEHPNSIISGVFYFNADADKDKIHFYNDSYKQIFIPPKEWNIHNSNSWWFPVQSGGLIIFPSHLTHMVEQTISNDTRVSLAFNVFAKGYLGDDDNLTGLRL